MITRARHAHIDAIKAFATIVVMMTHVLAYHLGEYSTWFLWNYSHFVVVGLIFCSAYLYADSHPVEHTRVSVRWFLKRFTRLYIPYLIYLITHAFLMNIFPTSFTGYGWQKTVRFFIQNLTLTGGVDFGWLPVLFIQLALFSPLLLRIARSNTYRNIYILFIGVFICISTVFRIPTQYSRLIAWLPWSAITCMGFLFSDAEKRNELFTYRFLQKVTICIAGVWMIFRLLLEYLKMPTSFDMHKYPPDISYLSYGALFTAICLLILHRYAIKHYVLKRVITYISKHSYQLFFIHFIYLDLVMTRFRSGWITEAFIVIGSTIFTSFFINTITLRLRKPNNIS